MSNHLKKELISTNEPLNHMTWEESVRWLRNQPNQKSLVYSCYFDDPITYAALRFYKSEEWAHVKKLLPKNIGKALDIGAGRGISSYALAKDGWDVTALEPDPSSYVGSEAISILSKESGLDIKVIQDYAETLPFSDNTFDLVYGRQVLHHARDIKKFTREAFRILKPGGRFIVTREHVISKQSDLEKFLKSHPLHKYYGGENAYTLNQYKSAIIESGFTIKKILEPYDSVINYYPLTEDEFKKNLYAPISRIIGYNATNILRDEGYFWGKWFKNNLIFLNNRLINTPGRLYSFVADK